MKSQQAKPQTLSEFGQTAREEADAFYSQQSIIELIDNDELTSGEEGFMRGYLDA